MPRPPRPPKPLTVRDLMRTNLLETFPEESLADAAQRMRDYGVGSLVAVDGGELVGIVTERDLLRAMAEGFAPRVTPVSKYMTRDPVQATAELDARAAAQLMADSGVRHLLVMEGRRPVGIVSALDLLAIGDGPDASTSEGSVAGGAEGEEFEVLAEAECLRLLSSKNLGRLALSVAGQPQIFPVNYATDAGHVAIRTDPGLELEHSAMAKVAFEVDDFDPATGIGWSVMVQGVAYEITEALDRMSESLRRLVVEPLAPGDRSRWLAVFPSAMSGRRLRVPAEQP